MATKVAELSVYGIMGWGAWGNAVREVVMHQHMVKTAIFMSVKTLKYQPSSCLFATYSLSGTYFSTVL